VAYLRLVVRRLFRCSTCSSRVRLIALWSLLLLALVSLASCAGGPFAPLSARLLAEGDRLAADGRQAEAVLAYRQAADSSPRNVTALRRLAAAYEAQGRRRLAARYVAQAVAIGGAQAVPESTPALHEAVPAAAASTGLTHLWERTVGPAVPTGVAFGDGSGGDSRAGGVLYVVSEDGQVTALVATSGEVAWITRLSAGATSAPGLGSQLVLVGDQTGMLHALNRTHGTPVWTFSTQAPIFATPVSAGDWVYCASGDGNVYALSAVDGALRWRFTTGGQLHAAPTLADGVLYFGSVDGRLYAVDALTGRALWGSGIPTQGAVEAPLRVSGGRVLAGSGDSRLYALAADHGGEYWRYSAPDAIYAAPLVVSDTVYAASIGHTLAALDLLSGEPRWEVDTPGPVPFTPVFAGSTLYYLVTGDPHLYAVDAATGQLKWQMDTGDWPAAAPVAAGEVLYLAGKDGTVIAYGGLAPAAGVEPEPATEP
jgi:outer membrane protein assembly factor BamB